MANSAGASKVRFTLDWRLHEDKSLLTKNMERLQGPAIHVVFDAALGKKEWKGLRNLERKWAQLFAFSAPGPNHMCEHMRARLTCGKMIGNVRQMKRIEMSGVYLDKSCFFLEALALVWMTLLITYFARM